MRSFAMDFPTYWNLGSMSYIILNAIAAMKITWDGLRCPVMLVEAQNCRKMPHFIASCGRALSIGKC